MYTYSGRTERRLLDKIDRHVPKKIWMNAQKPIQLYSKHLLKTGHGWDAQKSFHVSSREKTTALLCIAGALVIRKFKQICYKSFLLENHHSPLYSQRLFLWIITTLFLIFLHWFSLTLTILYFISRTIFCERPLIYRFTFPLRQLSYAIKNKIHVDLKPGDNVNHF